MADEDNAPATKEGLRIVVAEMEAAKKDAKVAGEFLQQEKKMDDQVAKLILKKSQIKKSVTYLQGELKDTDKRAF